MTGWEVALLAVGIYAAGWYITPFMMVWHDLHFPFENEREGGPESIRNTAKSTAQMAPSIATIWPIIWLMLLVMTVGQLHQKPLQKMIDKPLPGENTSEEERKKLEKRIRELEKETGIGQ